MKVQIVIGANYGDEGKGLMTDYLCRQAINPLVIRFNGGSQAGHTVDDGNIRHVFSHIGSGTLAGAPTFLSEHFVVNPYLFHKEYLELIKDNGVKPHVYVDPEARVTTIYDMLINTSLEDSRGIARHGSVGVGFGETIEQSERYDKAFRVKDLYMSDDKLLDHLIGIELDWFHPRMKELGLEVFQGDEYFNKMRNMFLKWVNTFKSRTTMLELDSLLVHSQDTLIFEGAQGLLLDQNGKDFPYVTRSNTGLKNVIRLLDKNNIVPNEDSEVIYMSRSYMTRHGAGPLQNEVSDPMTMGYKVVDETNKRGEYQGHLRFAPLDFYKLANRIQFDLNTNNWRFKSFRAYTHIDAMDKEHLEVLDNGKDYEAYRSQMMDRFVETGKYLSLGPYHTDVLPTKNLTNFRQLWS